MSPRFVYIGNRFIFIVSFNGDTFKSEQKKSLIHMAWILVNVHFGI